MPENHYGTRTGIIRTEGVRVRSANDASWTDIIQLPSSPRYYVRLNGGTGPPHLRPRIVSYRTNQEERNIVNNNSKGRSGVDDDDDDGQGHQGEIPRRRPLCGRVNPSQWPDTCWESRVPRTEISFGEERVGAGEGTLSLALSLCGRRPPLLRFKKRTVRGD
ncbi:hypothetical protein GWI33_018803 [Rhynchophorus ferrugineus]|uniref:Uncharacterized protein n=1 Tax=Rhynchophorus ferrugineus TaxID=354439 RepID=A0A834I6K2_RHYFE|nr:hypothetical protein GWI33_018803 [Rhynchophorus ferrugineus]